MVYKVDITEEAQKQFEACIDYVRDVLCQANAAQEIIEQFSAFTQNVSEFPEMYPLMLDERLREQEVRRALVKKYVALYRFKENTVTVLGFFHQTQDYAKFL